MSAAAAANRVILGAVLTYRDDPGHAAVQRAVLFFRRGAVPVTAQGHRLARDLSRAGPTRKGSGLLEAGRSPIVLTGRKDHLDILTKQLRGFTKNLVVLCGGASSKQRRELLAALEAIPDREERRVLATVLRGWTGRQA